MASTLHGHNVAEKIQPNPVRLDFQVEDKEKFGLIRRAARDSDRDGPLRRRLRVDLLGCRDPELRGAAALWWRSVRRTPWVLFAIALGVTVGMWLERYMILVASLYRDFLPSSWGALTPTFWDWATFAGTLGLFMVPFLIVIRLFPVISIFETKTVLEHEHGEADHGR
jgi:hypothetical protein